MTRTIRKGLIKKKIITREDNEPYLIRYSLFSCKYFSIKVHKILISDDVCLHDHPWAFVSLILKNGYWEHTPKNKDNPNSLETNKKFYGPFSLLYRKPHSTHRLEIDKPCWTLVISFKKKKSWGFYTPDFGFKDWKEYDPSRHC